MNLATVPALELVKCKNLDYSHFPLSSDKSNTINMIISAGASCDITVAPTHHIMIDADGVLHGFRVAYPQHTSD
eukprot:830168-Rhodomonas_salina.1